MSEYVPEITEELLAGFFDEAPEYLEMLDSGLMAFEDKAEASGICLDDPEDQARMNEMFRAAHSLKGLGAALGFNKIRELTHLMETLFDQVRMKKRSLDKEAIETLFAVFDKLKELIKELSEPQETPVSIDESLAQLELILNAPPEADTDAEVPSGDTPEKSGEAGPVAGETASEEVSTAGASSDEIASSGSDMAVLDNPELAQLFVETTLDTVDELNAALLKLEESADDIELINEVFRCAHNIKGASGAAGCTALYHLTHDMETALDLVRNAKLDLSYDLMQAVFGAVDRVRADVMLIRDGRAGELSDEGTTGVFGAWLDDAKAAESGAGAGDDESADAIEAPAQAAPLGGEGSASGDGELLVKVGFPKDFIEAEIQAYLIHNKLNEVSDVLGTSPDVENLDGSTSLEEICYRIRSTVSAAEVKTLVESYSVQSVEVLGGAEADDSTSGYATVSGTETVDSSKGGETKPAAEQTAARSAASPASSSSGPEKVAPVQKAKSLPAEAVKGKAPVKVGETIRVDLERLDQLMNLGGELVINKARLAQIQGRFDPLFQGQNLGYLVDDILERLGRLGEGLEMIDGGARDRKVVADLSNTVVDLSHDFQMVKGFVNRVHDGRGTMNDFSEALHALNRVSEGMQKRIMETRMVSVGPLFQRFRRVVRDIARSNGKSVDLILLGEATELDKRMIDELGDPLTHMIRNSVDHGLEPPEERKKAGKPATGQLVLNAFHRGRHICIEVKDDGRGVNVEAVKKKIIEKELATEAEVERMSEKEIIQFIFKPGFSTAEKVTDLSGRGMGMDIVLSKLEGINGTVDVESVTGQGATVTIKLPLTLAIITAIIARIGKSVYCLPLEAVAEIITVSRTSLQFIQQKSVIRVRERVIPVAFFEHIFRADAAELLTTSRNDPNLTLVILEAQDEVLGLVVDELIGQEDVVIKSIAENYQNVAGVTGASIMGDGKVALILDVPSIVNMFASRSNSASSGAEPCEAAVEVETSSESKEIVHAISD